MRVLLIKMSSLGDVVHTLPAITDAASHGIEFDWVVESAFEPIARLHPAVVDVLPISWRHWRQNVLAHRRDLGDFVRQLRQRTYDLVIDAQGLWKSALLTALARADNSWGFDHRSAREGSSTLLYRHHVSVPRERHAVDRLRRLFAAALGYQLSAAALQLSTSGIEVTSAAASKRCVICHGTTWPSKLWPEEMWCMLIESLLARGYEIRLPAAGPEEQLRARRIAEGFGSSVEVLPTMSLTELTHELSGASLVAGVDSGLTHLAAALGVPTLSLYGSTDASLTGARGRRARNLQAQFPCSPCHQRECSYRGDAQRWRGGEVIPACYARLTPDQALQAIAEI